MYTFDLFVYGHDISDRDDLCSFFSYMDVGFSENINGRKYELISHYHGGSRYYPYSLGCIIANNNDNRDKYIDIIRNANEDDYKADYNTFISLLIQHLDSIVDSQEDIKNVNEFKQFINNNKPKFYMVEVSS